MKISFHPHHISKRIRAVVIAGFFVSGSVCFALPPGDDPAKDNPCPVDADIWVLAGQSNMQGAGRTPDTLTDPKIWMMNLDDKWMTAREPLHRIFEATAPAYPIAFYQLWGN